MDANNIIAYWLEASWILTSRLTFHLTSVDIFGVNVYKQSVWHVYCLLHYTCTVDSLSLPYLIFDRITIRHINTTMPRSYYCSISSNAVHAIVLIPFGHSNMSTS